MNKCELCKNTARVYCESDEARLCWSCDAKVHSANFLVARHVRNLLCHSCQSPTPWNGSGEKLGRTISLCEPCVVTECVKSTESEGSFESGTDYDSDQNQSYNNQVASSTSPLPPPPPPLVSSSSSEDRSQIDINVSLKRSRDFLLDLNSKNDFDSSCIAGEGNSYVERSSSVRPFKFQKLKLNESAGRPQGTLTASRIAEPPRRIRHRVDMNEPFSGVEARECVDFDLNECPFEQHK